MSKTDEFLNEIHVAAPCPASWDAMQGDQKVRFCGECSLNVYNLSGMTADEAATLVRETEGRLCVRLFRRADGTVLTQDCPTGLAALRRGARRAFARAVALAGLLATGLIGCTRKDRAPGDPPPKNPPVQAPTTMGVAVVGICEPEMGKIAPMEDVPDLSRPPEPKTK